VWLSFFKSTIDLRAASSPARGAPGYRSRCKGCARISPSTANRTCEAEANGQQAAHAGVDFGFLQQTGADGGQQIVYSVPQSRSVPASSVRATPSERARGEFVSLIDVADGSAIGHHVPGEAHCLRRIRRAGAGWRRRAPIHAVVAHIRKRAALLDGGLELRQVGVEQVMIVDRGVETWRSLSGRYARRSVWAWPRPSGISDRRPASPARIARHAAGEVRSSP